MVVIAFSICNSFSDELLIKLQTVACYIHVIAATGWITRTRYNNDTAVTALYKTDMYLYLCEQNGEVQFLLYNYIHTPLTNHTFVLLYLLCLLKAVLNSFAVNACHSITTPFFSEVVLEREDTSPKPPLRMTG